ncbi:alternative ribosome rescue aminoacyl-tRNA hydrolase ArfB [Thalassotalea sp. G2M2-11]|uniref:alternative ribosome rescue aminoacyl-tRNA hydrolase ArfB n=1 Tax=Thalassotalea sp. G2M2-11 TaxID=2787627 RepID=UPI0019D03D1E|nr:alternative ribosome rescue aminoacyl-tRNA hydrolase ArfB [Thalassotalea sp. G2M2-11]
MIKSNITVQDEFFFDIDEVEITAIRSQGAGGQNVNKVSSAIHLRFHIANSSLAEPIKQRLLALNDRRINKQGEIIIKAQQYRTQEQNRLDALTRLNELIAAHSKPPKKRRVTKPSKSSIRRRLEKKSQHSQKKSMRSKLKY